MQSRPLGNKAFGRTLDPKGFWRVDKEKDPELRHTVLTLVAYHDLKEMIVAHGERDAGIAVFHNQNDGDGWMLPDTLCLAHYGLGHDDRAPNRMPSEPGSESGSRCGRWSRPSRSRGPSASGTPGTCPMTKALQSFSFPQSRRSQRRGGALNSGLLEAQCLPGSSGTPFRVEVM